VGPLVCALGGDCLFVQIRLGDEIYSGFSRQEIYLLQAKLEFSDYRTFALVREPEFRSCRGASSVYNNLARVAVCFSASVFEVPKRKL
jgi:hypothetical protein